MISRKKISYTFEILPFLTHSSKCISTASFEYWGWCIRIHAATRSTFGLCFWYRILWMASKSQHCQVAVVSSLDILKCFDEKFHNLTFFQFHNWSWITFSHFCVDMVKVRRLPIEQPKMTEKFRCTSMDFDNSKLQTVEITEFVWHSDFTWIRS